MAAPRGGTRTSAAPAPAPERRRAAAWRRRRLLRCLLLRRRHRNRRLPPPLLHCHRRHNRLLRHRRRRSRHPLLQSALFLPLLLPLRRRHRRMLKRQGGGRLLWSSPGGAGTWPLVGSVGWRSRTRVSSVNGEDAVRAAPLQACSRPDASPSPLTLGPVGRQVGIIWDIKVGEGLQVARSGGLVGVPCMECRTPHGAGCASPNWPLHAQHLFVRPPPPCTQTRACPHAPNGPPTHPVEVHARLLPSRRDPKDPHDRHFVDRGSLKAGVAHVQAGHRPRHVVIDGHDAHGKGGRRGGGGRGGGGAGGAGGGGGRGAGHRGWRRALQLSCRLATAVHCWWWWRGGCILVYAVGRRHGSDQRQHEQHTPSAVQQRRATPATAGAVHQARGLQWYF
jgi:hypothetical protein